MSKRPHWLHLAKRELLDGADFGEVIEILQDDGCSSIEAEELVEIASEELTEERAL